ncbi:hypothetical protein CW684_04660 [Macrococcoides caseolyticum]|nr:hypothetical protein CW684_04660 [Macrococcus caseolyticus]PKF35686.1 hypothetical protein CW687_04660 [Macrococcus caseolyticus]
MCPKIATYNTIFCPIFEIYSLTTIFVWFKMVVVPRKGQKKRKEQLMDLIKPPNLKLKQYMIEHDIKQKELAKVLGITQSLFSQKINENRSTFSLEEVRLLCAYLGLNMHEYFFEENVPKIGLKN